MIGKLWNRLKKIPHPTPIALLYTVIVIFVLIGLILLILKGYSSQWTGFNGDTIIKNDPNAEIQFPKRLWDWLNLLGIPLVLAGGALLFNITQHNSDQAIAKQRNEEERKIADDTAQETALQAYLEQMSTLLIDKGLRKSENDSEIRDVARAWTLTFLRRLNGDRKGILLRFLHESDLIKIDSPVIVLQDADLGSSFLERANLEGANLEGANLQGANLQGASLDAANLKQAHLEEANLQGGYLDAAKLERAHLEEVNLQGAVLEMASLQGAHLYRANLYRANLYEANLEGANLQGANLQEANLQWANLQGASLEMASLEEANLEEANLQYVNITGARYNKKTLWPKGFDPTKHGTILVSNEK